MTEVGVTREGGNFPHKFRFSDFIRLLKAQNVRIMALEITASAVKPGN